MKRVKKEKGEDEQILMEKPKKVAKKVLEKKKPNNLSFGVAASIQ